MCTFWTLCTMQPCLWTEFILESHFLSWKVIENEFCESWETLEFGLCNSWKVLENSILLSVVCTNLFSRSASPLAAVPLKKLEHSKETCMHCSSNGCHSLSLDQCKNRPILICSGLWIRCCPESVPRLVLTRNYNSIITIIICDIIIYVTVQKHYLQWLDNTKQEAQLKQGLADRTAKTAVSAAI